MILVEMMNYIILNRAKHISNESNKKLTILIRFFVEIYDIPR